MKEKWNYILYLIWFSYLVISAIILFGDGFLLSRKSLSDSTECLPLIDFGCNGREKSNESVFCDLDDKIRSIASNPGVPLACVPEKNRVLFLLVDALRYDFTLYDPSIEKPLPFQNRLPVLSEKLKNEPKSSRLYRFVADPPTTTFQRLKALSTGSLPTFIDISSNFAAEELQEDSVINQLYRNGKKIVLLGDDTWARLLPGKFLRSHAMYSFHTWDLDTVDNEVDSKIYDELKKDDWDLMIAHYLGVDHAGHRYGPSHPEMTRKLTETNTRIERILEMLPDDVLLFIIGDHGMTEQEPPEAIDGDHGGESKAEITAAFFAYRGAGLAQDPEGNFREVRQTDFASTLCAAIGRPPPAPSLGTILLSTLPDMPMSHTLLHISNNLKQVTNYLIRYGEESQQVSVETIAQLINSTRDQIEKASTIKTPEDLQNYVKEVRAVIDETRNVFRIVWVEFDSLSMMRALLLLLLVIFSNWLITEGIPVDRIPNIYASSFINTGIMAITVCVALCYTAFYFELLEDIKHAIIVSTGLVSGAITSSLIIMHWDGISQRWYEGRSPFYERFSRGALMASAFALLSNSFIIEEGASLSFLALSILGLMAWKIATIKALVAWGICGVVLSATRNYRGCREEQGDCWISEGRTQTGQASRVALVVALGSVAAVVAVTRRHIGWRGYGVVLAGVLVCSHWAVGWGTLGSLSRSKMLARVAWLVIGTMLALLWKRDHGPVMSIIVCELLLYLANTLVLGAAYAPSAGLGLLAGYLALNVVSSLRKDKSAKFSVDIRCSASLACLWALLASYMFYATGHHATLGHVRWGPAFHAGDPTYVNHFGQIISAFLVLLELFGMPLMFGIACPLLALWGSTGASGVGPRTQLAAVFTICLKFGLCFAIRVFACAIAATIHCRHLMIWGVFTPKLIFECGTCTAALLGTVIGSIMSTWHLPSSQRTS